MLVSTLLINPSQSYAFNMVASKSKIHQSLDKLASYLFFDSPEALKTWLTSRDVQEFWEEYCRWYLGPSRESGDRPVSTEFVHAMKTLTTSRNEVTSLVPKKGKWQAHQHYTRLLWFLQHHNSLTADVPLYNKGLSERDGMERMHAVVQRLTQDSARSRQSKKPKSAEMVVDSDCDEDVESPSAKATPLPECTGSRGGVVKTTWDDMLVDDDAGDDCSEQIITQVSTMLYMEFLDSVSTAYNLPRYELRIIRANYIHNGESFILSADTWDDFQRALRPNRRPTHLFFCTGERPQPLVSGLPVIPDEETEDPLAFDAYERMVAERIGPQSNGLSDHDRYTAYKILRCTFSKEDESSMIVHHGLGGDDKLEQELKDKQADQTLRVSIFGPFLDRSR